MRRPSDRKSNFFTRRARIEARGNISENVVVVHPAVVRGRPEPVERRDHLHLDGRAGGRRHADDHLPNHRPERPAAAGRVDRRAVREGGHQGNVLPARWPGEAAYQPVRADLLQQSALDRARRAARVYCRGVQRPVHADGFLSHDVGASLRYEYKINDLQLVTVKVGAYNGQGESLNDVNNKKSFGARATAAVTPKLDIGGSWFAHDGIVTVAAAPSTPASPTTPADVDAQWGKPGDEGLYVLGEYLRGNDATAARTRSRASRAWRRTTIRIKSPTSWLYAIEPAVRIDLADPNTDVPTTRVTTLHRRAWLLHVEQGPVPGGLRAAELPGDRAPRASAASAAR